MGIPATAAARYTLFVEEAHVRALEAEGIDLSQLIKHVDMALEVASERQDDE